MPTLFSLDNFTIRADAGVSPHIASSFAAYLSSHPGDVRQFLGLDSERAVSIRIAREGALVMTGGDVVIPEAQAEFVLARAWVRQLAGGMLMVPTLHHVFARGMLGRIEDSPGLSVAALAREFEVHRTLGYLVGAMRMLALHGLVRLCGGTERATLHPTRLGRRVTALLGTALGQKVAHCVRAIGHTKNYRHYIWAGADMPADALADLRAMVAYSRDRWGLSRAACGGQRVLQRLCTLLDGMLVCPVLVALGMPAMTRRDGRYTVTANSFFGRVNERAGSVELATLRDVFRRDFLDSALTLLAHQGVVEVSADECRLTRWGRAIQAPIGQAGVAGAYLRMYEHIGDILFHIPDPLGRADDGHCDRLVNIWGSGKISRRLGRDIADKIMRRIFDQTPLAEQPCGVADMGCGDGTFLHEVVDFIKRNTLRGRHLDRHPLVVVAADYYEDPRQRARETLAMYADDPGVVVTVVQADVSNPERYDEDIRSLAIEHANARGACVGAGDLVHTMVFLAHDRTLRIRTEERAQTLLRAAVARCSRAELLSALQRCNAEIARLPDDIDALVALVEEEFTTAFAEDGQLIPSTVAAADFIDFMTRWGQFTEHGMILAELHAPRHRDLMDEEGPPERARWTRSEQYGLHLWGFHFPTDQYPLPYVEHHLASTLAGLHVADGTIHGHNLYFTGDRQNSVVWYRSRHG